MNNLYIILEECINSKHLNKLVNLLLNNYKDILSIKKFNYKLNLNKYNFSIYSKSDFSDENLILMFRLVEKNFYKLINKNNKTILNYNEELSNNNSNNKYNVIITDDENNIKIFK